MNTTLQLAAKLERKSTFALMAAKICINSYVSQSEMHKKLERMSQAMLVNQVDVKEGIGAFFEKRYPQYSNSLSEYEGVKNEKSL
jgi:enoyl-CoA hydratase/carnithine racemase